MAKISVSLPDTLKEQLDDYAQAHGSSVSQTIQLALEAFFSSSPAPVPPELEELVLAMRRELQVVRREVARTQEVLEEHRRCLASLKPLTDLAGVAYTPPACPYD